MGFLNKLKNKTTDKIADRASTAIVNKMFGKKDKEEGYVEEQPVQESAPVQEAAPVQQEAPQVQITQQEAQAMAAASVDPEAINQAMGIAYNTKRCPECQAICMNSPVECPYCHADLRSVKPLTPKELEELE